ncbi:hypothetical protein [Thalassospira tepidiphila]|uniref:Uncharacterized protein n=2 Tax=Thalassospira tepidiphila TaxID=393657 RepID=A0A853KW33_9PROT|nr:hypothetical protein [Thalassospira tepidiphila]NJB74611.1 hypothetical protein [Thalassospira tepidiphila]OAZ08061.1 hypothetical protein TH4_18580 [Thalassospira tepidiphila MCCC 1A03514]
MPEKKWPNWRDIKFRPYFYRNVERANWQCAMGIHIQIGGTIFGISDMNWKNRIDGSPRKNPRLLVRLFDPALRTA